jgi:molybdate transport system ATP-binding protein
MTLDVDIHLRQGGFQLDARFGLPDGIAALFGPSGSGKSTVLAAIAGLKPAGGRVALNGQDVQHQPAHRRGIGLVFQDARLFPHLSVRGNIHYAWKRADPARRRDVDEVARFFDISGILDRGIANLSGGEQARVALARALIASPRLLLLDEPFAALDGARRRTFIRILGDMHRTFAIPMLVVTHVIDDAAALATHLVALQDGRVVGHGPFAETALTPVFRGLLDGRDTGAALPGQALVTGDASPAQSVWLRADHVLLASRRPQAISARNVLEGEVVSITPDEGGGRLVALRTQAGILLSRLTSDAVAELALAPGGTAWALVKAHAL